MGGGASLSILEGRPNGGGILSVRQTGPGLFPEGSLPVIGGLFGKREGRGKRWTSRFRRVTKGRGQIRSGLRELKGHLNRCGVEGRCGTHDKLLAGVKL